MPGREPSGRRRVVVRERGVLLLVLLDRSDVARRLRQHAEVARRDRHRPVDVVDRARDERVLGRRLVGRVGVEMGSIGRRVVAEPGGTGDRPALVLDRLELVETGLVDLLRVEIEGRPAADRRPVELLAVGRRPEARLLARGREVVAAQCLQERAVGRVDHVPHDLADPFAVGLRRHLDHRRHDRRLDRDGEHPLDLGDRPLGHDARRGQARCQSVAQDLGVGGHERRVGVEPGDERIEPLGGVRRLELGQLRQELLRPAHLVDDAELVERLVVLLDLEVGDDPEHVARDPVLGRQTVGRDRGRRPPRSAP